VDYCEHIKEYPLSPQRLSVAETTTPESSARPTLSYLFNTNYKYPQHAAFTCFIGSCLKLIFLIALILQKESGGIVVVI